MLATICGFIETIVSVFVNIYAGSYVLGRIIIHILASLRDASVALAAIIASYAVSFYEDFTIFMLDMEYQYGHIIKMLNNGCNNFIGDVSQMILTVVSSIEWMSEQTKTETSKVFNGIFSLFTSSAISLRNWIVLIGNSAWMLMMCIPNLTIATAHHILKFSKFIWKSIVESIKLSASVASDSVSFTVTFFTSVPLQSVCGLILIYLLIKSRRQVYWLLRIAFRMIAKVALIVLVKMLSMFESLLGFVSPIRNCVPNVWRLSPIKEDYTSPNANGSSKTTDPYHLCVICQDKPKSIVLLPCRHLCLCQECFRQLRRYRRECPMCRQQYEHSIQVYA